VTKTATVSLHGNSYEVDAALVGRRVELVFDPFDLTDIEVHFETRSMGRAVPMRIGRHVHPHARPEAPRHRCPPALTTSLWWPSGEPPSWLGSSSTTPPWRFIHPPCS